jgi:hypothetical protein
MKLHKINNLKTNHRFNWHKLVIGIFPVLIFLLLLSTENAMAVSLNDATFKPLGDLTIPQIIGKVISILLGLSGALALLMFVYGGVVWMTAQGNTEKVGQAQKILIWSILGLIIIFTSYAIVSQVLRLLGQS